MAVAEPSPNQNPKSKASLRLLKGNKPEKIRAELNIEKWPAIWQPSKSKTKPTVRLLKRSTELEDGTRVESTLEVGFTQAGTVTTEDQKMFYALVKQWEDSGKPTDQVFFSDRLLQRLLKKKWGTNVLEAITGSLRRLRMTPFTWTHSYHKGDQPKAVLEEETIFNLLADLKIIRRKVDGHITNQQGYFQFDKNILQNLLANYTKPLFLDDLFNFESEIAQLLYVHVDLILANKTTYERRTKELFEDLGLNGESYRYPSNRKQVLAKAIAELQSVRLSTGLLKSTNLEKTKDGKDFKIVFRKVAYSEEQLETLLVDAAPSVNVSPTAQSVVINDYSKRKDPLIDQAEELVLYFYKSFHGVDSHTPQAKETAQALSLISHYGFEKSRYVVEFSRGAAKETKFQPQTFGGIMHFTSRALADFDRYRSEADRAAEYQQRQVARQQAEKEAWARGKARLAVLTPEQYQTRFEKSKAELFKQYPFMAQQKDGNKIHEAAIRARVIQQLEDEPMDLMVIPHGDPA